MDFFIVASFFFLRHDSYCRLLRLAFVLSAAKSANHYHY